MKKQVTLTALALATAMTATAAHADDIKVSGKVFFDYSTLSSTTPPAAAVDTTGADITRTYLSVKKKIDDTWSAAVTFDSAYDSSAIKKHNNVFLKKAQLTGKFLDGALNVKAGMIGTPWIGYQDKLNKHRFISKSYVDTHKMASSADAGIGVFGKVDMFSYDVVSINGGGYGNTATTEKANLEARVGVAPIDGLTVDLGYRTGLGKFVKGTTKNKNTLTQLLVTYGQKGDVSFRVGGNFISNKIVDALPAGAADKTIKGTELWAWVKVGDFGGYLRNESTDYDVIGSATEKRTVIAFDYHASKTVIVSLVSDSTTDKSGTAGKKASKTGVFTQFKF